MPKRSGRKSAAQTPAPPKERIYGSKKNPKGSAASEKSAAKISLSESVLSTLKDKLLKFKEANHSKKNITLNDLKAVYRRGAGAYSSSHRPTISGGKPNTRNAWAMARVNKFLKKASGEKVKAAYVQDDDLMKMKDGGVLNDPKIGKDFFFEYHCLESDKSCDAELWYRSHQKVKVIDVVKWSHDNLQDRIDDGVPRIYKVRFSDGFEYDVFEDELMQSKKEFYRPDPKRNTFEKGGNMSEYLAPNGKPSNLTHEQWHLVRTPEFKAWFGDWENDPANASKVVDENGEPLVVYRSVSPKPLSQGHNYIAGTWNYSKEGYQYFAKNRNYARLYGNITKDVFLNIRDILDFNYYNNILIENGIHGYNNDGIFQISDELEKEKPYLAQIIKVINKMPDLSLEIKNKLKTSDGFYGYEAGFYGQEESYVVKNSNQIKLADGSNTTFDPSNPDIRYEKGGEITSETTAAFNRKIKRELPSIKREVIYDGYSGEEIDRRVNENIARKYMQYVAAKLGMKFGEIEFKNQSKKPTNHFQLVCSVWGDKNEYILWATFVYVNDNHQIDESQTKMELLNQDYDTLKVIHGSSYEYGGDILMQDTIQRIDNPHLADIAYYAKGGMTDEDKKETYKKWKSLVNMSKSELERFYNSEEGKVAGLTPSQAKAAGIDSGRESARWIMKMKDTPVSEWTPAMWKWAKKQISFVSRMSGNKGKLYDEKGRKTRKHLSLLIWGNNPEKYKQGGKISGALDEFIFTPENQSESINAISSLEIDPLIGIFNEGGKIHKNINIMDLQKFNALPHISTIKVGDTIVLKEAIFDKGSEGKPQYAGERFIKAQVDRLDKMGKVNTAVLKVIQSVGANPLSTMHITRPLNNIMKLGRAITEAVIPPKSFKDGGQLNPDSGQVKQYFAHGSGNAGGVLVGKRHSEGGIKAINKSTGQPLEMEGGEVVITRGAVSNPKKYNFNGKEMTTREILSDLNVKGGGVSFADGGSIPDKINCGCDSYDFGGTLMSVQDFVVMSENEYQSIRLKEGMDKEKKDHYDTLSKLNAGAITIDEALRQIAKKEMEIDPKYPFGE